MLFDFHKSQNDRRPGAVHATYLIYGTKTAGPSRSGEDGDVEMANNTSDAESIAEAVPCSTLSIVQEEKLQGMDITSLQRVQPN